MQSFPLEDLPIISAFQVTLRVGQENLFWSQKIQNWQNFLQICWNLEWRSIIKYHAQPKKLRPRFGAYHAFCVVLVPSLVLPLGFWSLHCKHEFVPNNDFSCAWACPCLCLPSPTASQDEYWPSQAKSLHQPQSPAPMKWTLSSSFRQLDGFAECFVTPWLLADIHVAYFFALVYVSTSWSYEGSDAISATGWTILELPWW